MKASKFPVKRISLLRGFILQRKIILQLYHNWSPKTFQHFSQHSSAEVAIPAEIFAPPVHVPTSLSLITGWLAHLWGKLAGVIATLLAIKRVAFLPTPARHLQSFYLAAKKKKKNAGRNPEIKKKTKQNKSTKIALLLKHRKYRPSKCKLTVHDLLWQASKSHVCSPSTPLSTAINNTLNF